MKKLCLILILIQVQFVLLAQTSEFMFHSLRERDGLSFNTTITILRDSRGLMWVGTNNGLNRYDGVHFNVFNARQKNNAFTSNTILDLCEDKKGNIWGATSNSIFFYNTKQNKFKNYFPPGYDYARAVNNILCDKEGNIWATGLWTILKLNFKNDKFEEIGPLTHSLDSLKDYSVRLNGFVLDPSGEGIWMATRNGLHYYHIKSNKFISNKTHPNTTIFAKHSVCALSVSKFGDIWYFDNTTKEIISFNPQTHIVTNRVNTKLIIPNAIGQTLFEDSQHNLWLSTWNNKMAIINYKENKFTLLTHKNDNPLSIPGDNFWDVWEDEDNNIWVATSGGLAICNYKKSAYKIFSVSDNVVPLKDGQIGTIEPDPRNKTWWIASEATPSIVQYDPTTTLYKFYDFSKAIKNKNGQTPSYVYEIKFFNSEPYILTHTGIWRIDESSGKIIPYTIPFKEYSNLNFTHLYQFGDNWWFSGVDGIVKWNKKTNATKLIRSSITMLPDSQRIIYQGLRFDSKNQPWFIPAFGWLGHVNEKDEVELNYYVKDKPIELSSFITTMEFDKKENLWMSSVSAGMYRYNPKDKSMLLLNQIEGPGTVTKTFTIDNKDNLWISSFSNIYMYSPETKSGTGYYLPFFEYTNNFSTRLKLFPDNSIMVTYNKYLIKFIPERINIKPIIKAPIISMIDISGKEKLLNDEKQLKLEPDENSLEFSFGSFINKNVFPYHFEYKLEGFEKDWKKASSVSKAIYNNLQSGSYTFRVRAISKNKNWITPDRSIKLFIRTPFYKAKWFWISLSAIFIGSIIWFYRSRLKKQRQIHHLETKAHELEKEKTVVMYDSLKQQLNPHFLFNSLTSLSGLIETDQQMAGEFLEQMSGMYRYMLKNRDSETVSLKDEIEFVKLYIKLQQTRFRNGLIVNINISEEYLHHKIAPVTLQNLIENAIKHNILDMASPLVINIYDEENYLVVKNNLQKKSVVENSNKKGLAQFTTLYGYLSDLPVLIEESEKEFTIKIPLL